MFDHKKKNKNSQPLSNLLIVLYNFLTGHVLCLLLLFLLAVVLQIAYDLRLEVLWFMFKDLKKNPTLLLLL